MSERDIALQTFALNKRFGGIHATDDVSISIARGARHALIGPNGAGKTTLINLLTGVLPPTSGRIELDGQDITHLPVHQRARRGLARTFQINQLFAELTPLQTIATAVAERLGRGFRIWHALERDAEVSAESIELLRQFHLADVMRTKTAALPYGKRRLLEIAIALAARPRVLLLDEPVAGVPDSDRHEILDTVAALPADVTVVLIEHDMDLVFSFARRISVLVNGALFVEGSTAEVARDPRVRAVYLGEEAVDA
ncbi:MAG: ABC transporter ATP-binding protein [Betaproteobacteria bacterium]